MQQDFISIPEVQVVLGGLCVALGEVLRQDAKLLASILKTLAGGVRSHAEREVFEYLAGCVDGTLADTAPEEPRDRSHLRLVN
jgi:hypothetical protein